jgi:hypothetical protein
MISLATSCLAALAPQSIAEAPIDVLSAWLRHDASVADVAWAGSDALWSLGVDGELIHWDRRARVALARTRIADALAVEAVLTAEGEPLGVAVVIGGDSPRIEFRDALDRPEAWSIDGLRGPLAVDYFGESLIAVGDGQLVRIDRASAESRAVFEVGDWTVADAHFDADTLVILTVDGSPGSERPASLAVVGARSGELRVLEPLPEVPARISRLDDRWIVFGKDARLWVLGPGGGVGAPIDLSIGPVADADRGGDVLVALGEDGVLWRSYSVETGVHRGEFIGFGARSIERAPTAREYALAMGRCVRLVDEEGRDAGGAVGPSDRVVGLAAQGDGRQVWYLSADRTVGRLDVLGGVELGGVELGRASTGGTPIAIAAPLAGGELGPWTLDRAGRISDLGPGGRAPRDLGDSGVALAVGPPGLFALTGDGVVVGLDPRTLEPRWSLAGTSRVPPDVGSLALTRGVLWVGATTLQRLDPRQGQVLGAPLELPAPVSVLAAAPDGRRLAVGLADGGVHLIDAAAPRPALGPPLVVHAGGVQSLVFDPAGERLASVGRSGADPTLIEIGSERTGSVARLLPWGGADCTGLTWSAAQDLVAGCADGRVLRWRLAR